MHFLKLIFGIRKILVYFLACNSKVFNDFLPVQLQLLPSPSVSSPLSPFGLCSALSSAVFGFQFATPSPSPTPSVTPPFPSTLSPQSMRKFEAIYLLFAIAICRFLVSLYLPLCSHSRSSFSPFIHPFLQLSFLGFSFFVAFWMRCSYKLRHIGMEGH